MNLSSADFYLLFDFYIISSLSCDAFCSVLTETVKTHVSWVLTVSDIKPVDEVSGLNSDTCS